MPNGTPSTQSSPGQLVYTNPDLVIGEVCARLSMGETLVSICRDAHMPSAEWVQVEMEKRPEIATAVGRARARGFDAMAEETIDISEGKLPIKVVGEDGNEYDLNDVQRDKLRVDTRLKLLAKWDPKRYGDSFQLKHADADGKKLDTGPLVAELLGMLGGASQVIEAKKDGEEG